MELMDVNFVGVALAAAIVFLFGWLWYSPMLFGEIWMRCQGGRKEECCCCWTTCLGGFLASFVKAWIFAGLLAMFGVVDMYEGAMLGFWIWLGFIMTSMFNAVLWAKMPIGIYLINAGFYLISLLFMGGFLVYWS